MSVLPDVERGGRLRRSGRRVRAILVAVAVLLGVVQAVVWSMVAPTQRVKVYADGSWASLPTSDWHPFDAVAIFAFSAAALGLILAIAAWRIRAIRGVATLVAVLIGAVLGTAVAYGLATLLAHGIDPATVGATGKESIVEVASGVGTPLVLAVQPLVSALVYTFLAAWDGRPDLGAPRQRLAAPAPASGALAGESDEGAETVGDGHRDQAAADIADRRP